MQILVLDTTTKSIKASMSGAATTTNPDFVATYADNTGLLFTEGVNDGALNGSSDVTLVSAPASATRRVIRSIAICNRDTSNNTITIKYDNNGSVRILTRVTLAPNETWTLSGAYNELGAQKVSIKANDIISVGYAAYAQANTARNQANSARDQANTARDTANGAYAQANGAYGQANGAYGQANVAANTVATFANGTLVLAASNLNFNNTETINIGITANGSLQTNVAFSVNTSAVSIPSYLITFGIEQLGIT